MELSFRPVENVFRPSIHWCEEVTVCEEFTREIGDAHPGAAATDIDDSNMDRLRIQSDELGSPTAR